MQVIRLTQGLGEEGKSHCVMAATSIVAGEPFSDKPVCVCPTITAALIKLNDSYGDNDRLREEHLGHLPWLIIGTRGTLGDEIERAFRFATWAHSMAVSAKAVAAALAAERAAASAEWAASAERAASAASAERAADWSAALAAKAAKDAAKWAAEWAAMSAMSARWAMSAEDPRLSLVRFIETDIIPVYSTMPVEPGFRQELLITRS